MFATLALGVAAFALWEVVNGHDVPPVVLAFFAPFVALGMGLELVSGVRALRAPTRRRFKLTHRSLGFLLFTGGMLFFGAVNFVDDDPQTSAAIGSVSIILGVVLAVSFLRYMAKPVHDVEDA